MCGIAGWYLTDGQSRDLSELADMSRAIAHRGPDDQGTYVDEVGGHRACASPTEHHRPQRGRSPADDGRRRHRSSLAFNGELYNFVALRRELEALGRTFRSRSDTEVVVNALAQWGPAALERFNGMFALGRVVSRTRTGSCWRATRWG